MTIVRNRCLQESKPINVDCKLNYEINSHFDKPKRIRHVVLLPLAACRMIEQRRCIERCSTDDVTLFFFFFLLLHFNLSLHLSFCSLIRNNLRQRDPDDVCGPLYRKWLGVVSNRMVFCGYSLFTEFHPCSLRHLYECNQMWTSKA